MPSSYDWSQGAAAATGGFLQGMRQRRSDDADDRRARYEEEQIRRQRASDARAEKEAGFQDELRPMRRRAMELSIDAQERANEDSQFQRDQSMRQIEREGIVETMQYLDAGMPDEAAKTFNSTGSRKTRGFRPHPAKKGLWLGSDEEGVEAEIDPRSILRALGKLSDEKPTVLSEGAMLVGPNGHVIARNYKQDTGGDGSSPTGMKATEAYRKYREILALNPGMSPQLAFAKAYDFIEKTTNPMGFGSAYTDLSTGKDIGTIGDVTEGYKPNEDYPEKNNNPKMGRDGNYYVPDPQRPGKFLRIDPAGQQAGAPSNQEPVPSRPRFVSPTERAEQSRRDATLSRVPNDPAARRMGDNFGIPPQATLGQRGEEYRQMALAYTAVEKDLRQGVLPEESDLFDAMQFAIGKGDKKKADYYQTILRENYGVR